MGSRILCLGRGFRILLGHGVRAWIQDPAGTRHTGLGGTERGSCKGVGPGSCWHPSCWWGGYVSCALYLQDLPNPDTCTCGSR